MRPGWVDPEVERQGYADRIRRFVEGSGPPEPIVLIYAEAPPDDRRPGAPASPLDLLFREVVLAAVRYAWRPAGGGPPTSFSWVAVDANDRATVLAVGTRMPIGVGSR
jgi:hypothetical protein